jgi:hypothetical protein
MKNNLNFFSEELECRPQKNGRRPQRRKKKGKKWKTSQSTKFNLIGCDTIVNSPFPLSYSLAF